MNLEDDSPPNPLKAFDAFPKVHQSYVHSRSSRGGYVSVGLLCVVIILFWTEMVSWWRGTEMMYVSVEKGVGHGMQLNVDITVAMHCEGFSLLGWEYTDCRCGGQCVGRDWRSDTSGRRTHEGSCMIYLKWN
jgi:Endoplasmic Reticulum-Golgi Intermediate Compartment (ERGIC)